MLKELILTDNDMPKLLFSVFVFCLFWVWFGDVVCVDKFYTIITVHKIKLYIIPGTTEHGNYHSFG